MTVTLPDPVQRISDLGGAAVQLPLRMLGTLAEPVRSGLGRDVRRSLGIPDGPARPATDPAESYLAPDGVARRVHSDLPSMVYGGLSALLLQSLHPLAMAGVADHSNYAEDPHGRLRRTAAFVGTTTFGSTTDARRAIDQVLRVHRRVRGIAPDGRPYAADDPELVTWIHVAEMSSFLRSAQRFGPHRLSRAECDAYYDETAVLAHGLGATWAPRSVDEATAYLRRMRPELYAGPQAVAARDFLLRGTATRPEDRAVYAVIVGAAVGLLPPWARAELGIPHPPLVDRVALVPPARVLASLLRWAMAPDRSGSSDSRPGSGPREPEVPPGRDGH
jgi:uncharacterized protein (DUF2236 family)